MISMAVGDEDMGDGFTPHRMGEGGQMGFIQRPRIYDGDLALADNKA